MRRTDVSALDDIILPVIDDPARGCMEEIGQVWQLVGALSEADKMRLFGRATLIEAALQCLSARFGSGGDYGSFFHNIYAWERLIGAAVGSSSATRMKLDDLATLNIVRAARCKLSRGARREHCDIVRVLAEKVPEPMSAAQRRSLVDLAEWVDQATPASDYSEVFEAIEPLFVKIGRPLAESDIFIKNSTAEKDCRRRL